jgi:hypothetical protein
LPGLDFTRRMLPSIVIGAALAVAALAAPVAAQMPQAVLTSATVKAFIASYPDVKATVATLQKQYGNPGDGQDDPTTALGAWVAVGAAQNALNAVVKPHGFDSFATWIQVLTSVATAYGFAKDGDKMNAGMADAIKQIQDNDSLSADQKKVMLQQMQAQMGSMASMASESNIEVVKPYVDRLAVLFQ